MDIDSEILEFVENENFISATGDETRVIYSHLSLLIGYKSAVDHTFPA